MPKIQGDFEWEAAGQRAIEALVASGVPRNHIRVWNLIPDANPTVSGGTGVATGAVTGFVVGGAPGLAIGAIIGAALDSGGEDGPRLPPPVGVRVVVDLPDGLADAKEILASCGAGNLCTLP
jgi:hypothetical protein